MRIFGKKVGKAIQIPPILKPLKYWAKRERNMGKLRSLTMPSVDNTGNGTDFGLSIPMPGFDKDNVKMELQGNTLIISDGKEQSCEVKKSYGVHRAFVRTTFRRNLDLPRDVDPKSIHATLKNRLLQVRFSKRETMY
ncbi:hypothetical protein DN53_04310 [Flagellimonas olearia]|uniref:SHSP domain-containing protein n=2 Tax=Flagellimonas olearia TaxID=552546 RepID=A0A444VRZ1_9FLAO|nr:hypothetical protein DN53_04310 [Allomuricauda olearia]